MGVIRHFARALKDGRATDVDLKYCKLGDEAVKILCSSIAHSGVHTLKYDPDKATLGGGREILFIIM